MNKLHLMPPDQRREFFELAAYESRIPLTIIEKDFWVVWTLERLFSLPDLKNHLTFKGGTSLSKVYGVIDRFSEDLDLSIEKDFFGYDNNNSPESTPSRKKQKAILEKLANACREYVQGKFLADLRANIAQELGTSEGWQLDLDDSDPDDQSLRFEYPTVTPPHGYIRAFVKIEMGARSEHWPVSERKMKSYARETLTEKVHDDEIAVRVLNAERTFWEKATILHRLAHLPEGKAIPGRTSRHFYDFFQLLNSQIKHDAVKDLQLLERVANHNNIYFASTWARYETARKGTLKLSPIKRVLNELAKDYREMSAMFYRTEHPDWDLILKTITEFEREFNNEKE
jgi:predicted nucleotidyltransferase component of viral defense system